MVCCNASWSFMSCLSLCRVSPCSDAILLNSARAGTFFGISLNDPHAINAHESGNGAERLRERVTRLSLSFRKVLRGLHSGLRLHFSQCSGASAAPAPETQQAEIIQRVKFTPRAAKRGRPGFPPNGPCMRQRDSACNGLIYSAPLSLEWPSPRAASACLFPLFAALLKNTVAAP